MMLLGLCIFVPLAAQGFSKVTISPWSRLTGSIIWPRVPSASSMAVMRYLSASSKPLMVRSAISCTEAGARTSVW